MKPFSFLEVISLLFCASIIYLIGAVSTELAIWQATPLYSIGLIMLFASYKNLRDEWKVNK